MAELDLLRSVQMLSTVSGGSITGALYALLLKRELEAAPGGRLDRDGYVALVQELDRHLTGAIAKNLRTRLLMHPWRVLRVLLSGRTVAEEMAHQYERHLFREVVDSMEPGSLRGAAHPGRIGLREVRVHPGGTPPAGGIGAYNRERMTQGESVITALVMNATCLNSGRIFRFSSSEVGDPELGFVRYDEIPLLQARKRLLELLQAGHEDEAEELELNGLPFTPAEREGEGGGERAAGVWVDPDRIRSLARWLLDRGEEGPPARREWEGDPPPGWEALFTPGSPLPGALPDAPPGRLRTLKRAAANWIRNPSSSARCRETILDELGRVDGALPTAAEPLLKRAGPDGATDDAGIPGPPFLQFLVELYWLTSAPRFSHSLLEDWEAISLADAVGASACFPPVFPPYRLSGLYDDGHVSILGLTDGGVYDNMGVTTLVEEGCDVIIASDTSGLFHREQRTATGRLGLLGRLEGILTRGIAESQREGLRERRRVSRSLSAVLAMDEPLPEEARTSLEAALGARALHGLAYFHIESPPVHPDPPEPAGEAGSADTGDTGGRPPALAPLRRTIAGLRTDLDGFGEVEIAALVNHGYDTADRYIRGFLPELGDGDWTPPTACPRPLPAPDDEEEWARWERILNVGRHRFLRSLYLGSPLSWLVLAGVVASLAYPVVRFVWRGEPTLAGALRGAASGVLELLGAGLPWVGAFWLDSPALFRGGILGLVAFVLLRGVLGFARPVDRLRSRRMSWGRWAASVGKGLRSRSGHLGWLLGWFPLVVAGGASLVAGAAHLLFHLPFQARTRLRAGEGPAETPTTDESAS